MVALRQPIHPMQWNGFASPLHFEFVRARADRRTAKIKEAIALPPGKSQEIPIQEKIRLEGQVFPVRRAPDGFDSIAEARQERRRDGRALGSNDTNVSVTREALQDFREEAARIHRSSQVSHVLGEHRIKIVQKLQTS